MRLIVIGILLAIALLVAWRLAVRAIAPVRPRYDIYLANRTQHDLEDLYIYFDNRIATGKGILVKGGCFTHSYITLPVPTEADVRWMEQNARHAVRVKLEGIVPPSPMRVNIWFLIEEDGSVTVENVGTDDRVANQSLLKTLPDWREEK